MTWTNDEKPSVYTEVLWSSTRELWNSSDFEYIEFPWVYTLTNRWTNDSK